MTHLVFFESRAACPPAQRWKAAPHPENTAPTQVR